MNFICNDCAGGVHDGCKDINSTMSTPDCDCQHREPKR